MSLFGITGPGDSGSVSWRGWKALGRALCLFVSLSLVLMLLFTSATLGGRFEALFERLLKEATLTMAEWWVASDFWTIGEWPVFEPLLSALSNVFGIVQVVVQWSETKVAYTLPVVIFAIVTATPNR